ncbi:Uncharacterised protein [Mycobacteroides abscessus subsp. massiliense]|nr:Uncharacterised protein [Mycobacteroides abscessus subsp. massiliense]
MFNLILSDNLTLKSTSLGKTSDAAGMSNTSSNVKDSLANLFSHIKNSLQFYLYLVTLFHIFSGLFILYTIKKEI